MNTLLSHRSQLIKPSATLALGARANQLKAEGKNIINFTVGEPDFDTPELIKEAAIKAMRDGFTKYTPVDGTLNLKKAIAQKFLKENHLSFDPAQIMVSTGAKQCLYNAMQALLNPGDEVLIPAPYWVSYPDMAFLADATPVFIDSNIHQHFKITAEQLQKSITERSRLFIINSPSNPSGMAYTKTELSALAEVLLKHKQISILSDDIYEHIYWGKEPFVNILNVCPELSDRTLVINGVSKAYAMTGWRIGYAAGNREVIKAMTTIQSQSTSNPNSIAQAAAQAALEGPQECIEKMNHAYQQRHAFMIEKFNEMPDVTCLPVDGTFYLLPSFEKFLQKNPQFTSDYDLAEYLLNDIGVAVVPGSAFGAPNCLRLSFATDMKTLEEGIKRINLLSFS
jgi:aspartate aminotransferase